MELLSRRSSDNKILTLKRSKSFRASMKLMSKIRSHANLRLPTGFDLSSMSKDFTVKGRDRNQQVLDKFQEERSLNSRKDSKDRSSCFDDNVGDETFSSSRKISLSRNDVDSREIRKDLKSKVSLTDRVISKSRKNATNPTIKDGDMKSPNIIDIFRKKCTIKNFDDDTQGKDCNSKQASCETDVCRSNKHMSYENPTFVLDNSLDSSVSSFFFESEQEEKEKQGDCKSKYTESHECKTLTVVVDSHKAATNQQLYCKVNYKRDEDEDTDCLENEETKNGPKCEMGPLRCLCETSSENSQARVMTENRRTAEWFTGFDRSKKFYCKMDKTERRNVLNCLQDQKFLENVKTCSTKSCKIKTVDNITNFWTSKRSNSFRNKMAASRKRDTKEAKDYEWVGQEQVLASTSSGSSMLDQ